MARDPYTVLGVSKSASEGDIKSAFRKMAKRYHPDANKNADAAQRFSEVNAAYEVVGDKDKRRQYDRGEIDADGQPAAFAGGNPFAGGGDPFGGSGPFGGFGTGGANRGGNGRTWRFSSDNGGGGVDEILREFMGGGSGGPRTRPGFGQAAPERGADLEVIVTVSLEDIASGEKVRVSLPTGRTVDVALPPAVEQDQQIRLRGLGQDSRSGGPPGDAIVTLRIASHSTFEREGQNLLLDLPITLYDAALGAKVRAPTLTGSVFLTVPKGASSGKVLRLRGMGLPKKDGAKGDLMVTLLIDLPRDLPADFVAMMERWREDHPYYPRTTGA